jgi:hypothetical protein
VLYPGSTAQVTVDLIDATDQLSAVSFYVEKYETGTMGYELGSVTDGVAPSFVRCDHD